MPAKIKRSPRVLHRPLTVAEKLAILRAALLGEPCNGQRRATITITNKKQKLLLGSSDFS